MPQREVFMPGQGTKEQQDDPKHQQQGDPKQQGGPTQQGGSGRQQGDRNTRVVQGNRTIRHVSVARCEIKAVQANRTIPNSKPTRKTKVHQHSRTIRDNKVPRNIKAAQDSRSIQNSKLIRSTKVVQDNRTIRNIRVDQGARLSQSAALNRARDRNVGPEPHGSESGGYHYERSRSEATQSRRAGG